MKDKLEKIILPCFLSLLLSIIISSIIDYYVVMCGFGLKSYMFLGLIALLFVVFFFVPFLKKRLVKALILTLIVIILLTVSGRFALDIFRKNAEYIYEDNNKNDFFTNHKVMIIVPHQDDDINLLGSSVKHYLNNGSELFVVFTTNGDYYDNAEVRYQEALKYYEDLGVSESNIIFLGYGDSWDKEGPHIYNAKPGQVVKSYNGKVKTYGTKTHPSYNGEKDYTIENYLSDIESVILEYRPDVIFCNDYDCHEDHRATSLAFEKVMGKILKENINYKPIVYKGYAYATAWWGTEDFYALNSLSTKNAYNEPEKHHFVEIYDWNKRVRIPVMGSGLSRSIFGTDDYRALLSHESQNATEHIFGICSSDKVFWKRRTDSICYTCNVKVTSGNKEFLNDFMLFESRDVSNHEYNPYDGVWTPDDIQKEAAFSFDNAKYIDKIVLYDNPSIEDNVLEATIVFDDGTKIKTGMLNKKGIATEIPVNKDNVSAFTIKIEKTEGENAGLTEVEAFENEEFYEGSFITFMDKDENFAYDYIIEKDGSQVFEIYSYGRVPDITKENYDLTCDNKNCTAEWVDTLIRITCPIGEKCTVTLLSKDGELSSAFNVRNPSSFVRFYMIYGQKLESTLYQKSVQDRFSLVRLWERVFGI